MFEPSPTGSGPSGLRDWPRPFVFRALHLDGRNFRADSKFYFDIHLFDTRPSAVKALVSAFAQLGEEGLGPGRGRAELMDVLQVDSSGRTSEVNTGQPLAIDLATGKAAVSRVAVRFVSPTELKSGQALVREPNFGVLAARLRDRVSTLRAAYGGGALQMDFSGFGERADRIKMTHCTLTQVDATRHSTRTGQTHSIGGFTGEAEYQGDLREFVPFLKAAQWTGVGRQTVWGKGEIRFTAWP